eukprot:m.212773 g.212773  ORF g.212773 m.212773 type:complete len:56 (-) comp16950_c3_seq1:232-399(-)
MASFHFGITTKRSILHLSDHGEDTTMLKKKAFQNKQHLSVTPDNIKEAEVKVGCC